MRTSCLRLATARKRVRGFTETTLRKTKSERKGSRGQGVKGSRRTGEQENRGIGEEGNREKVDLSDRFFFSLSPFPFVPIPIFRCSPVLLMDKLR